MNEKELIKGEFYDIGKWKKPIIILVLLICFIVGLFLIVGNLKYYEWDTLLMLFLIILVVTLGIIGFILFLFWWLSKMELVITDKRVYGKVAFGKRVDLPLDSVTSVGTSFFKGIAMGTSSGKMVFKLVKNRDDVHRNISQLLLERQQSNKK